MQPTLTTFAHTADVFNLGQLARGSSAVGAPNESEDCSPDLVEAGGAQLQ